MTLPVVVTKSLFHERPLESIGTAPPACDRKPAGRAAFFISSKGAPVMSAPPVSFAFEVRAVGQHGDAVADQLDMTKLLGGDGGDEAVEGA